MARSITLRAIKLVHTIIWAFFVLMIGTIVGRYTEDRAANFDIYLPAWLAARTKVIFGPLFGGAVLLTAARWAVTLA